VARNKNLATTFQYFFSCIPTNDFEVISKSFVGMQGFDKKHLYLCAGEAGVTSQTASKDKCKRTF